MRGSKPRIRVFSRSDMAEVGGFRSKRRLLGASLEFPTKAGEASRAQIFALYLGARLPESRYRKTI
jgi:hypothetical protein